MMKTRKSLPMFLFVAAVVAAVPIGWAAPVQAQGAPQGAPSMGAGAQIVQGKVTALDPAKGMLTLEDGTQLTIPSKRGPSSGRASKSSPGRKC